ncbi:MAG TPA: hypothetical protein PKE23_11390 [Anaerolineales bacterium]|nr:hypothetical protein [Anaerolineales bacterium]
MGALPCRFYFSLWCSGSDPSASAFCFNHCRSKRIAYTNTLSTQTASLTAIPTPTP